MRVWKYGDDINTDMLFPGKYTYSCSTAEEIKPHLLEDLDTEFAGKVQEGDIIFAGKNFGCGSSREHAPLAIAEAGCGAVVAESYARIFYRNSINGGYFAPFESQQRLIEAVATGNEVELDTEACVLKDITTGAEYVLKPLGDAAEIIKAGGVFNYARNAGMLK
ncbi:MAG: 3-isopropylmalate dehydratase small subunit [Candidatus Hydrogenedentes bacterium]|nr:3-isopropylmalate dehydratase small subunit [Candidatus Hydrogenedentota bacterium]